MSRWLTEHRIEALRRRALQLAFNLATVRTEIALLKARLAVVSAQKAMARHCGRPRMVIAASEIVEIDAADAPEPGVDVVALEARDQDRPRSRE